MAKEITTSIVIKANPITVWTILTDFKNYPNWNPFIKSIEGEVEIGARLKAKIQPPKSNGMIFKPKVLVVKKNNKLSWLGRLLLPGIFDGKHCFELIDNGDGTTTFIQSELFKGILVPFFKKQLKQTKIGFEQMNEALKIQAEKMESVI